MLVHLGQAGERALGPEGHSDGVGLQADGSEHLLGGATHRRAHEAKGMSESVAGHRPVDAEVAEVCQYGTALGEAHVVLLHGLDQAARTHRGDEVPADHVARSNRGSSDGGDLLVGGVARAGLQATGRPHDSEYAGRLSRICCGAEDGVEIGRSRRHLLQLLRRVGDPGRR